MQVIRIGNKDVIMGDGFAEDFHKAVQKEAMSWGEQSLEDDKVLDKIEYGPSLPLSVLKERCKDLFK